METYKAVFARFVFTPELEADVAAVADRILQEWNGRSTERLPRIEALRTASEFREGFGLALRDVAGGYHSYEHLMFCELVPGYKERYTLWEAEDPATRPPDILTDDELRLAERMLLCAMALARAIHKAFHPYHDQTYILFEAFAETVRRSFASQGFPVQTSDTPHA